MIQDLRNLRTDPPLDGVAATDPLARQRAAADLRGAAAARNDFAAGTNAARSVSANPRFGGHTAGRHGLRRNDPAQTERAQP